MSLNPSYDVEKSDEAILSSSTKSTPTASVHSGDDSAKGEHGVVVNSEGATLPEIEYTLPPKNGSSSFTRWLHRTYYLVII